MDYRSLNKLVINLPERKDRLENVKLQLSGQEYSIVEGIKEEKSLNGIAKSHLKCVQIAKDNKWQNVLIMEDDLVLRPKFEEYLNHCLYNVPTEWDVLLGGVYLSKNTQRYNDHWDKIGEFRGLHFYIVNQSAYTKVLSYELGCDQHIDAWMNRHGKRLNCFVTKKYVATQMVGYSDNVKAHVNYEHLISNKKLL